MIERSQEAPIVVETEIGYVMGVDFSFAVPTDAHARDAVAEIVPVIELPRTYDTSGAAPDAPPTLELKQLTVDLAWQSILRAAPVVDELRILNPTLRVIHLDEGRYDFDDVVAKLAARPKRQGTGSSTARP